ncbi:MAG: hypothetical protein MJZ77_02270 [Bacteroidales bacterium]|nr:hypothetical protein [Bacteroidales bacterium]
MENLINNTFSWDRFTKLVAKDFRNIWSHAGTTLLIITLLPLAIWLFWWVITGLFDEPVPITSEIRCCMIWGVVTLAAIVAPARLYRTCNLTNEGIYYAMLPASKLEKFLSMSLFTFFVCPLLCLVASLLLDLLLTALPFGPYQAWLWQCDMLQAVTDEVVNGTGVINGMSPYYYAKWFWGGGMVLIAVLIILDLWLNAAVFFFTNTIFKRHKILSTFLWLWLISFVLQLILTPLFGIWAVSTDFESLLTRFNLAEMDPIAATRTILWVCIALQAIPLAILVWWSGHRLKKMTY